MKKLYFVLVALAIVLSACGGSGQAQPTAISLPTAAPTNEPNVNPTAKPANAPDAGTERTSPSDGMIQVYIPDGTFLRGGVDTDAASNEIPSANVTMTGFWMDKLEVTNGMYKLCVDAGVCQLPHYADKTVLKSATRDPYFGTTEYADYPVIYVTWTDANAYCNWAGRQLPTEAQWEYAARGGSPSLNIYPWGTQRPDPSIANFVESGLGDTSRVGSYPNGASPFGILDMSGNVAEWVSDFYDMKYYQLNNVNNPTGPIKTSEFMRVVRGGHYGDLWKTLRVSFRSTMMGPNPEAQKGTDRWYGLSAPSVGFRCVAGN